MHGRQVRRAVHQNPRHQPSVRGRKPEVRGIPYFGVRGKQMPRPGCTAGRTRAQDKVVVRVHVHDLDRQIPLAAVWYPLNAPVPSSYPQKQLSRGCRRRATSLHGSSAGKRPDVRERIYWRRLPVDWVPSSAQRRHLNQRQREQPSVASSLPKIRRG